MILSGLLEQIGIEGSGAGTQRCHAWHEINCLVLDDSLRLGIKKGKNCGSGLQVLNSG